MTDFTQDDIAAIIGAQQLEIIALRRELARLKAMQQPANEEEKPDGTT